MSEAINITVHVDESQCMNDPFIRAMHDVAKAAQEAAHAMRSFSAIWCFPSAAAAGMRIVNKRGRNKLILVKKGDR